MRNSKLPNAAMTAAPNFTIQLLTAIMPRQNGSPAGLLALHASLLRGKELVK